MLEQLRKAKSIDEKDFQALHEGYRLLRSVDHEMRLIVGRSATLPAAGHSALSDIARRLDYSAPDALVTELQFHMSGIRDAYERIIESSLA
jgi:glutamine synthetase adenylyltransferase